MANQIKNTLFFKYKYIILAFIALAYMHQSCLSVLKWNSHQYSGGSASLPIACHLEYYGRFNLPQLVTFHVCFNI